ncbi:MAG: hypothetical protein KAS32_01965 [Candidatus Peribacteraceae bacterium]|nr:hypothetical protein [Candidatus Peribacteraceae bacterium]
MSDEIIWTYTSQVVLESNGSAAVASDAFGVAGDADLAVGNHLDYPWADFVLTCGFGGGVGAGKFVRLYRQDLNIDTTNDAPTPSAACPRLFIGSFVIPEGAAASVWNYPLTDVTLIKDQQYSIENKTDQTISANWELKAIPKTYKPKT